MTRRVGLRLRSQAKLSQANLVNLYSKSRLTQYIFHAAVPLNATQQSTRIACWSRRNCMA